MACYYLLTAYLCLTLQSASSNNIQGSIRNNTFTLGYTISWNKGWRIGPQIGSAIILGINEVHTRQLLPGYSIEWVLADPQCEPRRGMQVAVDIWNSVPDLDGFISDGCSVVCQPMSLLAAAWKIPVISWGCTSASLSDKTIYPTFTRVEGPWNNLGPVFDGLANMMGWDRVGILTNPEDIFKLTAEAIRDEMVQNGKTVIFYVVETTIRGDNVDKEDLKNLRHTLQAMMSQCRIIYLLAYSRDLRIMLVTAMDLGMMNGQYAFVALEFSIELGANWTYRPEVADDKIFDGLIGIGVKKPSGPQYDRFLQDVLQAFQER